MASADTDDEFRRSSNAKPSTSFEVSVGTSRAPRIDMSQPRRILAGMTAMITRRTVRRTHLLRPDADVNNLFLYCLAVTAPRFGVEVHAAVAMSTHEHLIVTDTRGQLPRFLQDFHRLFALGIKSLRKWEGAVWDHEKTSVVELRTPRAVLEKLAYVIANPVAAGLVERSHQWPGITTRPQNLGRTSWTIRKPKFFFDQESPQWPATATLTLSMPPRLDETDATVRSIVADEVERLEISAHVAAKAMHKKFLGRVAASKLSPFGRATSWEPIRARNPSFAVGHAQRDAFVEAVTELRMFRHAHRVAIEAWQRGMRDVLFPVGTWLMRAVHGARVQAA